jgi:hypothetical protein
MKKNQAKGKTQLGTMVEGGVLRRILLNDTGQMSIFIAMIFQVLFVMFAMVINIGLLVHDKINLQNAVDLAAFYGAQKQADLMNEIAHMNYQIRQDNKLLAWRYRVLGTLGRAFQGNFGNDATTPPARRSPGAPLPDTEWINSAYTQDIDRIPAVCVANEMWSEYATKSVRNENLCFNPLNQTTTPVAVTVVIAPFVPGVIDSRAFSQQARNLVADSCVDAGGLNWALTMQMIYAYKLSIGTRKSLIWKMRENLVSPDFRDREGRPVREGVLNTLQKNLTRSNVDHFKSAEDFEFYNGLSHSACSINGGAFAFPEIQTAPLLMYNYAVLNQGACMYKIADHTNFAEVPQSIMERWDPGGQMRALASGEAEVTNPLASSLGFEKNPWCMGYVGVKASTAPRKPFAPFGDPVRLQARAFAQPFGGRVGPWYRDRWTRGADKSDQGDRIDPLTSPRRIGGGLDSSQPMARFPNYSRYPGDQLGLKSQVTLGAQRHIFSGYRAADSANRLSLEWYSRLEETPQNGDALARVESGNPFQSAAGALRRAEVAAITPDIFDITYYSIDPNYPLAYIKTSNAARLQGATPVMGMRPNQIPDLGGRLGESSIEDYNIERQIQSSVQGGLDPNILDSRLYYVIRQWEHLLTSWAPHRATIYSFPVDRFGKCSNVAPDSVMIPGKCTAGGRTGYSVRLISRNYLYYNQWKVGGEGSAGSILNQPPPEF